MLRSLLIGVCVFVSFAAYGADEVQCSNGTGKVLSTGPLYEMKPWTEWQIVKCPQEKPSLRLLGVDSSQVVHRASSGQLTSLGFMDASRPARKLEEIGVTWRISAGARGYDVPIWVLREGKHRLAFLYVGAEKISSLGVVKIGCAQQVDIDPTDTGVLVTVRKGKSGVIVEEKKWALTK